tara:strand:- start:106 stop:324 length:219 start_codon:yes stop_codon:yes gene_type:complete
MKRKTTNVQEIKEFANMILAKPDHVINIDEKRGIITMIERILHQSGNYNGFMFNDLEDTNYPSPGWFDREYF